MKKVLLVHKMITPIRTPLFAAIKEWYAERGIEFKVVFLRHSESNRKWATDAPLPFDHTVLNQKAFEFGRKDLYTIHTGTAITKELEQYQPDIVINFGWDHISAYLAQNWCKKNKRDFVLWADSTAYETSWRRTLTGPLVRWFIKRCTSYIAGGTRSKEYMMSLGAKESAVEVFYNTVDIETFVQQSISITKQEARQQIGVTTEKMVLCNGQLIQRKGIYDILEVIKQLDADDTSFVFIGDGQEREAMEQFIKEHSLKNVILKGFVPYSELPLYYKAANVMVLASYEEVWGLVINEALACGTPVITTTVVGAGPDLIKEPNNGIIIVPGDIQGLISAITTIVDGEFQMDSQYNKTIIEHTSITASIQRGIVPVPSQ